MEESRIQLCEFYPTEEMLNKHGPFCDQNSDVSGVEPCTYEVSRSCQWALEGRTATSGNLKGGE